MSQRQQHTIRGKSLLRVQYIEEQKKEKTDGREEYPLGPKMCVTQQAS